jgi:hypothetical protein
MLSSDAPTVSVFSGAAGHSSSHSVAGASLPGFGQLLAWWTLNVFDAEQASRYEYQLCAVEVHAEDLGVDGIAIVLAQVDAQVEAEMAAIGAEPGYGTVLLSVVDLGITNNMGPERAKWVARQLARVSARCRWACPAPWSLRGRQQWSELVNVVQCMAESLTAIPVSTGH